MHLYKGPVDALQYDKISLRDTVASLQGFIDLGLIDEKFRIIEKYRSELSRIAEYVYKILICQRSRLDPNVFLLYSRPDRLNVTVKNNYNGGLRKLLKIVGFVSCQRTAQQNVNRDINSNARRLPVLSPELQRAMSDNIQKSDNSVSETDKIPRKSKSGSQYDDFHYSDGMQWCSYPARCQRTPYDERIFARDHYTCRICGAKGVGAVGTAELYVENLSRGGCSSDVYLWTVCVGCSTLISDLFCC